MDLSNLNIIQWNAQSLNSNKHIFTNFLYTQNIHIAIISETWFRPEQSFKIKYYNIERNDCGNKHNGVAIIIHQSITYTKINTYFDNSLQNVCIKITVNNKELSIVSFYSPLNCIPAFNKDNFDLLVKSVPSPFIFAGDFNAHHTSWGCVSDSPRGREILQVIDENNLVLLNDGQVTTVGSLTWRPNALDLSFVSSSLALNCEWSVHDCPLGSSYHIPVIIKVMVSRNQNNYHDNNCLNAKHLPIYPNYKLVDWQMYSNCVEEMLVDFQIDNTSLLDSYRQFCTILRTAASNSIVKSNNPKYYTNTNNITNHTCHRNKIKAPSLPWWNQKCIEAVVNFKSAYINFKNNPTDETYLEFKRLRAIKKLTIKTERQKSWFSLCGTFNRCTPLSVIWKFMRKYNKTYHFDQKENDAWVSDFLKKYTPDFVTHPPKTFPDSINSKNSYLLNPFTINELISAISSRRDTAYGLDGMPYILFKKLSIISLETFLKILNSLWENNIIPQDWKVDCLVPILKPDKPKLCPDSYRPIALTSCIGKLFEQLLKQRLEFYVEQNKILPSNQFGFRRNRSSRESICQLQLDIHNSLLAKNNLVGVFFDVAGAFNSVNIDILCHEFSQIGIPVKMINWIKSFLSDREVFTKFNRHLYGPRLSSKGVCQGGILSPLIFILYIRRLNIILGPQVKNLQFADDLVVYASGSNLSQTVQIINDALVNLYKYFSYLDLSVNQSKSKVVVFGKQCHNMLNVQYNNCALPISPEVKFLGVLFTYNLTWNNYIKQIISKANKAYNILKSLSGSYWGADPKILLLLYKSLVRSHFEYGFYCFAADVKIVNSLDVLQNKCLRVITGAFKSTPINAMQIDCNVPPLSIRFNYLKERFVLKLYSVSSNGLLTNLLHSIRPSVSKPIFMLQGLQSFINFIQNLNIYQSEHILPCYEGTFIAKFPAINITLKGKKDLPTKEEVNALLSGWSDHKFVYTDGSKNDRAVSFAIYEPSSNIGIGRKIDKNSSIFTAEAVAILSALKHIKNCNSGYNKWIVVSDSMSVLENLANNKLNANTNYLIYLIKELWVELYQSNIVVSFVWVPSHIGVEGNEKVDYLAKKIVDLEELIPNPAPAMNVCIPPTDAVSLLRQRMCQEWGRQSYQCTQVVNKGTWYATLDVQINSIPWFCKNNNFINRKFYSIISRMRFGHCRLNHHLYRLNMVNSPNCEYCQSQEVQSLHHIFFECSSFNIQRLVLSDELLKIFNKPDEVPQSIQELLRNVSTYIYLYKFIVETVNDI